MNEDIAFLAASCEREMRQSLMGSGIRHNRTDFRRFLGNGTPQGTPPQYQQPYAPMPQYPVPQQYPPGMPQYAPMPNYNNNPVDPNIPDGVLPKSDIQLIPLPGGAPSPTNSYSPHPQMESVNGFSMPDYNAPRKTYLEDEKEFRDALIEEIKSLKNNIKSQKTQINKLTKLVESLIVKLSEKETPTEQSLTEEPPLNDHTTES